ncbi:MAG: alpha-hydroxy acid oxidase [Burkholderiales bacterium]
MKRRLYNGADVSRALNIEELREMARRRLPHFSFQYIDAGAEDEVTLVWNRKVFERWRFAPNTLVDTSARTLEVPLYGVNIKLPLIIAPTGFNGLAWPKADVLLARAAAAHGIPFTLSTFSTAKIEEVAEAGGRLWLQLYLLKNREIAKNLLARAAACGYEALAVTSDANVPSGREWDQRSYRSPGKLTPRAWLDALMHPHWGMQILSNGMPQIANVIDFVPPEQQSTAKRSQFIASQVQRNIHWEDFKWLRDLWKGKLLLKGVLTPEDAERAHAVGAEGVVLTNHGGRQLESCISPMEVLPEVVRAVGNKMTVIVDSGFRRGGDVVKAMALGAHAVMIGRATLYGVAAAGEPGAKHALNLLTKEIDRTMGMLGRRSFTEIDGKILISN